MAHHCTESVVELQNLSKFVLGMKTEININCDLGEGIAIEPLLFPYIYSCSVACGGHYGDRSTITKTIGEAIKNDVKVGAHPSYPDRGHFGRRSLSLSKNAFQESMQKQLRLYFECLNEVGGTNHHVKAHGALYNDLAKNADLAQWYLEVVKEYDYGALYVPYGSEVANLAIAQGMEVQYEAFLDRNYLADGALVPRSHPKALKQDSEAVWQQLQDFIQKKGVATVEGTWLSVPATTFCLHGDHPKVLNFLKTIQQGLQ